MFVPELRRTGYFLKTLPEDVETRVQRLASLVEWYLADAALSLDAFEQARLQQAQLLRDRSGVQHDRTALRLRWEAGSPPQEYLPRLTVVPARSYALALSVIRAALDAVTQCDVGSGVTASVEAAIATLDVDLPGIKNIRDSTQHIEERAVGEKRETPIAARAFTSASIQMATGNFVLDSVENDNYLITAHDGSMAQLPVNRASLALVRDAIQTVLDALPWDRAPGPEIITPAN